MLGFKCLRSLVGIWGLALGLYGCSASDPSQGEAARIPRQDTVLARKITANAEDLIAEAKWDEAEKALLMAIDADLTFGPAHNSLGVVYLHENNLYQAAWEFQYAAKLMPYQPEPRNNLGLVMEQAGKLDDAIDSYNEAIKIEPDNPQFVGNAARACVRRGDKDQNIRDLLSKVVSNDTRPPWVEWAREKLAMLGPMPSTDPDE